MEQTILNLDPMLQLLIVMASFTVLPIMFLTMTSFLRFAIVLSILKTAMGTQQVPPAMVLVGLSMVLTMYTMNPVFSDMYKVGYDNYQETNSMVSAMVDGIKPLKDFMLRQTRQGDLEFFVKMSKKRLPKNPDEITLFEVAPAYLVSELKTSFEIGFIVFIPFIVIDMVVANILLALGMMMLSPTIISLPFKILIFIAVDGWSLVIHGLVQSFN